MKNKNIKRKGYILMIVIIIMFILTSVVISVTMLSTSHSNDIIKDTKKTKAYYISYAALEMIYAVLSETKVSGKKPGTLVNLIETAGEGKFNKEKKDIISKVKIDIKNKSKDILGYADISVDLKRTNDDRWYYKILSTGKLRNSTNSNVKDTHTLTMIVFKDDSNNPKVYEGDKNIN